MFLNIFTARPKWYRNGIWWFTKIMMSAVGENTWNKMRMIRRIQSNRFYYEALFKIFTQWPDMAQLIGIYPKHDSSHGFPAPYTYQMYRDWQENTLNSDGSYGMWIYFFGALFCIHLYYNYIYPYLIDDVPIDRGEEHFYRLRDHLSATVYEELCGNSFMEWAFTPHDFHAIRNRMLVGYMHPDDPRTVHMNTLTRKNMYKQHYISNNNESRSMLSS